MLHLRARGFAPLTSSKIPCPAFVPQLCLFSPLQVRRPLGPKLLNQAIHVAATDGFLKAVVEGMQLFSGVPQEAVRSHSCWIMAPVRTCPATPERHGPRQG